MDEQGDSPHHDPRVEQLRARLDGRRAILVGNRNRSTIADWLRDALGLRVDVIDCANPRKLGSARDAILGGNCDLVLVITSFVGHSVDHILKPACGRSATRFIPIGKGRQEACIRALVRALL